MKKPAIPPLMPVFTSLEEAKRVVAAFNRSDLPDSKYLHWDKLRFLDPPEGLTSELWWWALRSRRSQASKGIPLRDTSGRPFQYGMPDLVQEAVSQVDRQTSGSIQISEQVTSLELRDRYIVSSLIEEAIASSQLEGAVTTRDVAKEMIRSGRKPRGRDERMIANNFEAMNRIREEVARPLTPAFVLELHGIVTASTLDDPEDEGRLRTTDEIVVQDPLTGEVVHQPPPASELANRLEAMCSFANGEDDDVYIHDVVRSILLHFWLAYDHPFVDGNGRTARALFYWSMLRRGYWLTEFLSVSRLIRKAPVQYARSFLHVETDQGDVTYFLVDQLRILRLSIEFLREFLRKKMRENRAVQGMLDRSVNLNHRQIALLGHALRHPGAEYSIESHKKSHRVAYATSRSDLLDLQQRALIAERKVGRKLIFAAQSDLAERIRSLT